MSQDITAFDGFCGAGGSSSGISAAGVRVKTAVNHWKLAIETHNLNHPDTDHHCVDMRAMHPSFYPRTTIAWFSPECTNHSIAKGKTRIGISQMDLWGNTKVDPAEERSRATMREVVEFTAYHRYEIVIVENVVDIRYWQHYDAWLTEMTNLGYDHKMLYLNARFFGVPQSRDRFYAVFWKKGNKAPDLDFTPLAICHKHGLVSAVQSWKKPSYPWGRYGNRRQYIYRCPICHVEVVPPHTPAWTVIDWSIEAPLIGDRKAGKELKPKTIQRILAGLKKFSGEEFMTETGFNYANAGDKVRDIHSPLPTQTTRQQMALVQPFIHNYKNENSSSVHDPIGTVTTVERHALVMPFFAELWGQSKVRDINQPLAAITRNLHHGFVTPPFMAVMKNSHSPDGKYTLPPLSVDEPLSTVVASTSQHALIIPPFTVSPNHSDVNRNKEVGQPFDTVMPNGRRAVVIPPALLASVNYFDDRTIPVDGLLPTQTSANKTALVVPPSAAFMINYYNNETPVRGVDEPMYTVATRNTPALIMSYYGRDDAHSTIHDALPVIPTANRHSLVLPSGGMTPEEMLPYCGFRMLHPKELKLGMGFADSYVILGNLRDQTAQAGNAVCPPVAYAIVQRCVESLQ